MFVNVDEFSFVNHCSGAEPVTDLDPQFIVKLNINIIFVSMIEVLRVFEHSRLLIVFWKTHLVAILDVSLSKSKAEKLVSSCPEPTDTSKEYLQLSEKKTGQKNANKRIILTPFRRVSSRGKCLFIEK